MHSKKNSKKKIKETFAKILQKLSQNQILTQITNRDLTIILGDTGCGKSTLVNFLLKSNLIEKETQGLENIIDLEEGERQFAKIGHSIDVSETVGFSIHYNEEGNLILIDTQGFLDSRGVEYQISFSLLFDKVREVCRSMKFIFCIGYSSFKTNRMGGVKKNFKFVRGLFGKKMYLNQYSDSILVLVTKHDERTSIKKMKTIFNDSDQETLRILQERVFFYDPLNGNKNGVLNRDEFLDEINKMPAITEKFFNIPFSTEEKLFFKDLFSIFKNEIAEKTQENKYLDVLSIYKDLEFFHCSKIKFIQKLIEDFDDIITPCLIGLENSFFDACNFGNFKAAEIYIKILESFLKIKQFTRYNYNDFEKILKEKKKNFKEFQKDMKKNKLTKEEEKKLLDKIKKQIQSDKNERIKKLSEFLDQKLKRSQDELSNEIKNLENEMEKKDQEEKKRIQDAHKRKMNDFIQKLEMKKKEDEKKSEEEYQSRLKKILESNKDKIEKFQKNYKNDMDKYKKQIDNEKEERRTNEKRKREEIENLKKKIYIEKEEDQRRNEKRKREEIENLKNQINQRNKMMNDDYERKMKDFERKLDRERREAQNLNDLEKKKNSEKIENLKKEYSDYRKKHEGVLTKVIDVQKEKVENPWDDLNLVQKAFYGTGEAIKWSLDKVANLVTFNWW